MGLVIAALRWAGEGAEYPGNVPSFNQNCPQGRAARPSLPCRIGLAACFALGRRRRAGSNDGVSRLPRLLPLLFALLALASRGRAQEELPVWDGVAPGSAGDHPAEVWQERGKDGVVDRAVTQVHRPTITVFLPAKGRANGVALLIAPGGGYSHVTIDKEGSDVARWLAARGIAGIVLKYRLPKTPGAAYTTDTALADAVAALRLVRAHSAGWGIDPAKLGMLGFSAGGNLAALAGTRPPREARPSFLALLYPSVPAAFGGVPADVAPSFIVQANDDPLGTENSIRFYQWVRARKVPAELHLFVTGGHGFGLGPPGSAVADWPALLLKWLAATGFLPSR